MASAFIENRDQPIAIPGKENPSTFEKSMVVSPGKILPFSRSSPVCAVESNNSHISSGLAGPSMIITVIDVSISTLVLSFVLTLFDTRYEVTRNTVNLELSAG